MSSILIDLRVDAVDGPVGVPGKLVATASRSRVNGSTVVYPRPISTSLRGSGPQLVNIPEPGADWYWLLQLYIGSSSAPVAQRTVQWDGDVVAWANLRDVNPVTFDPLPPEGTTIGEIVGEIRRELSDHVDSPAPHPAYDDDDLVSYYTNGKA